MTREIAPHHDPRKVAIITGASRGIGAGLVAGYRRRERASRNWSRIRILYLRVDGTAGGLAFPAGVGPSPPAGHDGPRAEGIKVIPMAALRVSASAGADGPVVVLSGEADPTTAAVLREMLAAQLETRARLVTVDASGLSFLDSASVRVLVLAARALKGRHGRLVLARPQPIVARLLEITGADRLLDVRELAGLGSRTGRARAAVNVEGCERRSRHGVGLLRWAMNSGGSPLLSVRAEARQLVAPDYAVVDGLIEQTAGSKAEAVRSVTGSLDRLTADLAALGAVPFDAGAGRRPLTWSAHSWSTREELYHDKETMRMERTGQVTATVALQVTVRDLDRLDNLSGVLAAHPGLNVHGVTWHVDWDNPAWPQVRAAAISAAIGKARDYAAALGATVQHVEHIADAGLLGGDTAPYRTARSMAFTASSGGDQPGTPALTPVPQELIATIEARFRATGVSLPDA